MYKCPNDCWSESEEPAFDARMPATVNVKIDKNGLQLDANYLERHGGSSSATEK